MKNIVFIGVMSGTSLDGLDMAAVRFDQSGESYSFEIIHTQTVPYSPEWKSELANALHLPAAKLLALHHRYGKYIGECVANFLSRLPPDELVIIASHGHTVHHRPEEGFTFQLGHGDDISLITGKKVIYDFRTRDVVLGGQGAPLVPVGDRFLFDSYTYRLNLGGFSNISYETDGITLARDICAVNTVLNRYAARAGVEYDDRGHMARKGKFISELAGELDRLSLYKQPGKSLGIETVHREIFPLIDRYNLSVEDILHTYTEHIARKMGSIMTNGTALLTGGGTHNDYLVGRIKSYAGSKIIIPGEDIVDYKEALIFAFLGKLRLEGKINVWASVTGSAYDHSSGIITQI